MDAWTDDQLNKMKLGGNKRLNDFLGEYEIDRLTPIIEKYHSRAAEVCFQFYVAYLIHTCAQATSPQDLGITVSMQAFREIIKAESKGDTYSLPPRDQLLGSVNRATPAAALNKVLPSCP